MRVGIIGLGYVGLPLAVAFAEAGADVAGVDGERSDGRLARGESELGAEVSYHDPHVPEIAELGVKSCDLNAALDVCDLAVIVTAHDDIDLAQVVECADRVLDLRGATRGVPTDNVICL